MKGVSTKAELEATKAKLATALRERAEFEQRVADYRRTLAIEAGRTGDLQSQLESARAELCREHEIAEVARRWFQASRDLVSVCERDERTKGEAGAADVDA